MPHSRLITSGIILGIAFFMILLVPSAIVGDDGQHLALWFISSTVVVAIFLLHIGNGGTLIEPMAVLFAIWALRFFLPAALFSPEGTIHPTLEWIGMVRADDFYLSGVIANAGVISVYAGWSFASSFPPRVKLSTPRASREVTAAIINMSFLSVILGVASLLIFVASNGSLWELLVSGGMRSVDVQSGTGIFFHASLAAIPGAVVYAYYQYEGKRRLAMSVLIMPVIVFLAFAILGGRIRALLPLGAFLITYMTMTGMGRPNAKLLAALCAIIVGFAALMPILNVYRQAGGLDALATVSGGEQVESLASSLPAELGQLQGIHIPLRYGEGSLRGSTYKVLLFPLNNLLGMEARNTGVLVRDLATGPSESQWGFHPTMIGDAILNFGRWFVLVQCFAVGLVLGAMRNLLIARRLPLPVYVLLSLYLLRAFFEATDKMQEVYEIAFFCLAIYWPAWMGNRGRSAVTVSGNR